MPQIREGRKDIAIGDSVYVESISPFRTKDWCTYGVVEYIIKAGEQLPLELTTKYFGSTIPSAKVDRIVVKKKDGNYAIYPNTVCYQTERILSIK